MNATNQLQFVLQKDCASAELEISEVLKSEGYVVFKSFDLHSAINGHKNSFSCNCQMVVLMIYPLKAASTTQILDGDEYETAVFLINDFGNQADSKAIAILTHQIPGTLLAINPLALLT